MPKTVFTATDAAGFVHIRKTERSYSHTVVYLPSYDRDMAHADRNIKEDGSNWRFYADRVATGATRFLTNAEERAAEYASEAQAIAGERAKRVAFVRKREADGYYDKWQNAGWCGRPDLAAKLLADTQKWTARAVILPATAK